MSSGKILRFSIACISTSLVGKCQKCGASTSPIHYGFIVDYLAEALHDLRRHNFTEIIDRLEAAVAMLHASPVAEEAMSG
jgi:hypothetical protein